MAASLPSKQPARSGVLLVDLQRDFLASNARMPIDRGQVDTLIAAANGIAQAARAGGAKVLYVVNEFAPGDWLNFFRNHAAVRGTAGAEIDPRVLRDNDLVVPKTRGDAFSNPALEDALHAEHVRHLFVVGLFAGGCVRATVAGAMRRGYRVTLVREGVGAANDAARDRALRAMERSGASVLGASAALEMLRSRRARGEDTPEHG